MIPNSMEYQCHCDPCRCEASPIEKLNVNDVPSACTLGKHTASPPVGAHLVTPRLGYVHHGIYAGEDRVLHYSGLSRSFEPGPIEEVSLSEFAADKPIRIACRDLQPYDGHEVVRRARSRLGEDRYDLFQNNCEHFAEWSLRDHHQSLQIEYWQRRAGVAFLLVEKLARALQKLIARGASQVYSGEGAAQLA
jgi:hypothetical protein